MLQIVDASRAAEFYFPKSSCLPLVDLRSPGEFAQGAIPGAVNVPLLDNDERARVGILYKNSGSNEAVALGFEIFAAKCDHFGDQLLKLAGDNRNVVLHCWRGGMRSSLVGAWLSAIGLDVYVLAGGYKSFRRYVLSLFEGIARVDIAVLVGRTGVGKTDVIRRLKSQNRNFPCIDLEGLARHRGSAFGDFGIQVNQPTQQNFENELAREIDAIMRSDGAVRAIPLRIIVEIENFIGAVMLPQVLRKKIMEAPKILLERDFADRVERLTTEYVPIWNKFVAEKFCDRLKMLQGHISGVQMRQLEDDARCGNVKSIVEKLLLLRYDKLYDKSIDRQKRQIIRSFDITRTDEYDLALRFINDYASRS